MTKTNPVPLFDLTTIMIPPQERRVVPFIVVRQPGIGTMTYLKELAEHADMPCHEVRCAQISGELDPLPVLDGGVTVYRQPTIAWLKSTFMRQPHVLLILDEAAGATMLTVSTLLAQTANAAQGPVYAALLVAEDEIGRAQAMIAEGLGILPAEIPVRRVVLLPRQLEAAIAFARADGLSDDVADFLTARSDMGLGMQTWIRYDALTRNEELRRYGPIAVETFARGLLGDEAYDAYHRWLRNPARKQA